MGISNHWIEVSKFSAVLQSYLRRAITQFVLKYFTTYGGQIATVRHVILGFRSIVFDNGKKMSPN